MFMRFGNSLSRAARIARHFRADRKGVAAVEFALVLPVLIVMYFGTLELTQAVSVNQKVTHLSSSVADLVTQTQSISGTEMSDIFKAASSIMAPFDPTSLKIIIAAVDFDEDGNGKVGWSAAHQTSPYATNQPPPVSIPNALQIPNTQVIIGKVDYTHNSMFSQILYDIIGRSSFDYEELFILKPRISDEVTFTG